MNESKFDGMGKSYAQFRPTYPQAFVEYLCEKVGVNKNSTVADIGSGTGILTRQLLEVGSKVFAVEPNSDMSGIAEADLCGFTNLSPFAVLLKIRRSLKEASILLLSLKRSTGLTGSVSRTNASGYCEVTGRLY
jgi:SAM-dependent methyltransferase